MILLSIIGGFAVDDGVGLLCGDVFGSHAKNVKCCQTAQHKLDADELIHWESPPS